MIQIGNVKSEKGILAISVQIGDEKEYFIFGEDIDKKQSHDGKLQHKSLEDAEKAAASFSEKKGILFEGYKCRHCDFWHVGRVQSCY